MLSHPTTLELDVGLEIVERLILQRPPLLLVDRITSFSPGERPRVVCGFYVSETEPVLAGHFPGSPLWPGAYTIEGLGQAANVLAALDALATAVGDAAQAMNALRAAEHGPLPAELRAAFAAPPKVGMSAAVDIKLLEPIFAETALTYDVQRTHALSDVARFSVEARAHGRPIARGSITGASGLPPVKPPPTRPPR